ncbi:MAG TPA: patatin-like phospholipase family protein [Ktedonobacterales bacterium]
MSEHFEAHVTPAPGRLPRSSRRAPRWWGYTAFVFSGGGARGALQAGAVRALYEAGIMPDVLVGTSIGAWNASMLARTPGMAGLEQLVETWGLVTPALVLLGREAGKAPPSQAMTGALVLSAIQRMSRGSPSLYGDTGLRWLIDHVMPNVTFEDLALPLHVIATNLSSGEREIFTSGPLMPALLASSAIPGIFPPVYIGDSVYVDGGVVDSSSVETALAIGARRIVLLDVGYDPIHDDSEYWKRALRQDKASHQHESAAKVKGADSTNGATADDPAQQEIAHQSNGKAKQPSTPHPLAALLERAVQVSSRYQTERALARVPSGVETHVLRLAGSIHDSALTFGNSAELIEHGYAQATSYLKRRGLYREPAPQVPVIHIEPAAALAAGDTSEALASDMRDEPESVAASAAGALPEEAPSITAGDATNYADAVATAQTVDLTTPEAWSDEATLRLAPPSPPASQAS